MDSRQGITRGVTVRRCAFRNASLWRSVGLVVAVFLALGCRVQRPPPGQPQGVVAVTNPRTDSEWDYVSDQPWDRSGRWVYFTRSSLEIGSRVWRLDVRTGREQPIIFDAFGVLVNPARDEMAFVTRRAGIVVSDLQGRGRRELARPAGETIAWDPRGTRLARLERGTPRWRRLIVMIDPHTGEAHPLAETAAFWPSLTWTSNMTRVAYIEWPDRGRGFKGTLTLFTLKPRHTDIVQGIWLSPEGHDGMSWSQERMSLAVAAHRDGSPGTRLHAQRIFLVDVTTRKASPVTVGRFDYQPDWSPDGNRIAFTRHVGGTSQLNTIAPDGSDPSVLVRAFGTLGHPSWSPSGKFIAVCHHEPGTKQGPLRSRVIILSPP